VDAAAFAALGAVGGPLVKDSGSLPCEYRDLDHGKSRGVGKMMVIFDSAWFCLTNST
jgi:hypothetical protein